MAAFMTPDSESGVAVYPRTVQMMAPIPMCLDSPATSPSPPPSLSAVVGTLELVDILQCLLEQGTPELTKEILFYLSAEDLIQCLQVNSLWNKFISQDSFLMKTITKYKDQHRTRTALSRDPNLSRPPLRILWERPPLRENVARDIRPRSPAITPLWPKWRVCPSIAAESTPLSTIPRNIRMQSCPQCNSPAKELNLRRASCTKCGLDYCKDCFQVWHEVKCKGIGSMETEHELKRSSSLDIAGNARSRKRLKRLLI